MDYLAQQQRAMQREIQNKKVMQELKTIRTMITEINGAIAEYHGTIEANRL